MQIRQTRGPLAVLLFVPLALLATSAVSAGARRTEINDFGTRNDRLLAAIHATMIEAHAARVKANHGDLQGSKESLARAKAIAETVPEFDAQGEPYFELPAIVDRVSQDIARLHPKQPGKRDRGTRKITG
jgi:hypothetical protein